LRLRHENAIKCKELQSGKITNSSSPTSENALEASGSLGKSLGKDEIETDDEDDNDYNGDEDEDAEKREEIGTDGEIICDRSITNSKGFNDGGAMGSCSTQPENANSSIWLNSDLAQQRSLLSLKCFNSGLSPLSEENWSHDTTEHVRYESCFSANDFSPYVGSEQDFSCTMKDTGGATTSFAYGRFTLFNFKFTQDY
jgi:hypothetical protein